MSKIIDWNVEDDIENIRDGAIELQSSLHQRMYSPIFANKQSATRWLHSGRTYWRYMTLEKFEVFIDKTIGGSVLEIGAGTGWCSAVISKRPDVSEVYAVEYDPHCIHELMPKAHQALEADISKISYVLGSFNKMPTEKRFDIVVSIGALHHSENLTKTFGECFRVLKPGGYLLASEPCEPNLMSQAIESAKADKIDPDSEAKYGKNTRRKDNSDHYLRLCQYESTAYFAGFDVYPYVFDNRIGQTATDRIFKEQECYQGFQLKVFQPYFAKGPYDRLMLILRKPFDDNLPDKMLKTYEKQFSTDMKPSLVKKVGAKVARLVRMTSTQ